ncbi:hypothetical protein LPTSP3_g09830 [Leptospira kobayashii]|uniref:Lipoprotein n=1 Tax=Leptospira kobayashii TaxID=1917830 RepID=A0ABN6KB25_9LEPT|nr:hypothetical protein [Leptospira kobayashii]BDA78053.1 hypothetical protein LPTSP3_g09830 [Leptospira kobayashii]
MKTKLISISILFFYLFAFYSCASTGNDTSLANEDSDSSSCYAKGESIVFAKKIDKAKTEALHSAFKDCVQRALGTYISSSSSSEEGELVSQKVIAESGGYISNYKILKEEQIGSFYKLEISAKVAADKIKNAFTDRINAIVDKNPIGPCGLGIYMNRNSEYDSGVLNCTVNDISIDPGTIEIKLPHGNWTASPAIVYGISKIIQVDWKANAVSENSETISDLILGKKISFRYISPNTNKTVIYETYVNTMNGWSFEYPGVLNKSTRPVVRTDPTSSQFNTVNGYFKDTLEFGKKKSAFCSANLDANDDGESKEYSVNLVCNLPETYKKSLVLSLPGFSSVNAREGGDKTWLYFDAPDNFSIICRQNFSEKNCLRVFLEILKSSKLSFKSNQGEGLMIFETVNCNVASPKYNLTENYVKLLAPERKENRVQSCVQAASKI